jgi:hypothetical protein
VRLRFHLLPSLLPSLAIALLVPLGGAGWLIGGPGSAWAEPAQGTTTSSLGEPLQPSSEEQRALSAFLQAKGALFYGAWWCPACFKQKNLFGKEGGARLPYVECDKTTAGRERCQAAGIRAYPTWVMGNSRVEGVQTIEELKRWSRYPGSTGVVQP